MSSSPSPAAAGAPSPQSHPHAPRNPIWVKICGIRDVETARQVVAAGADALGLNFYAPSPRSVMPELARELSRAITGGIERVGLFVNHPVEFVLATARDCQLDTVQLHGDETVAQIAAVARAFPVIRAFRVGTAGLGPVADELTRLHDAGVTLRGALVDAQVMGAYGGTGQTAPWELVRDGWDRMHWPPLILAGGLTCENVSAAVAAVRPWGVDVAGGVESSKACKDPARVREFVIRAQAASGQSTGP
ncbi:MAG: phosphoribosylanthranilate isomerase [Planctomycetaceae bacterium]